MFTAEKTRDRIEEDLQVCEAMAGAMSTYLDSAAVYYPLATTTYPNQTHPGQFPHAPQSIMGTGR